MDVEKIAQTLANWAERSKDLWSITLLEFVELAEEANAGLAKMQASTGDDEPVVCVIAVRGKEECAEILEAIHSVEIRWELRRDLDKQGNTEGRSSQ